MKSIRSTCIGLVAAILLVTLSGCAETRMVFRYADEPKQEQAIVWPQDGETPRYRYVGQLLGEQNFAPEAGQGNVGTALVKAFKWVAGVFSNKAPQVVLQRPQTGLVGADGRIYVTDVSRQGVYVFDTVNGKLSVWSDSGTIGGFVAPIGIALTQSSVLVADAELGAVLRLDYQGAPQGFFGAGVLTRPTDLAVDPSSGWVYVSDSGAHNIKVFKEDGTFVKVIGRSGTEEGMFNSPTHLSLDNEKLYVTDSLNSRIQIFSAEGEFLRTFGQRGVYLGDLPHPKGVAVDSDENVYVVESYHDHLLIYDREGRFLLPIGGTGSAIGQFYLPAGVWSDDQDRIYVSDMFNGRIIILQYLKQAPEPALMESKR